MAVESRFKFLYCHSFVGFGLTAGGGDDFCLVDEVVRKCRHENTFYSCNFKPR